MNIINTLIERDGITRDEAVKIKDKLELKLFKLIEQGRITEAQDVCYDVGLEPDYLEDLLF